MTGTLYIVATPIGNLADISARALDTLRHVAVVFAEDTRVSSKLLKAYGIPTPLESFHQHSTDAKTSRILEHLRLGADVALVSDAGTPGVNDPGGMLVESVMQQVPEARIVPIPGPNAAITALSVSGVPADSFRYRGFVPQKKGRQTFVRSIGEDPGTQVFYEAKYRIVKLLQELTPVLADAGQEHRVVVVARELTKKHETIYRGTAHQVLERVQHDPVLGEFVVIIGPVRKS